MKIEVNVDTSKFDRMMADFPGAIERAKTQALKDIGAEVVSQTQRAFRHPQYRPSPWEPRKPTYIVKVNKKTGKKTKKLDDHPLLIKSGALSQSFFWFKIHGDDRVTIMSDRKYAGYHQFGVVIRSVLRPFCSDTSDELRDHTDCDEDGENHDCPNRRRTPVFEFVNWIPPEVHAS